MNYICVATNGSIIPSDEVLEILCKYEVTVRISDYGFNREKAKQLKKLLDEHGCKNSFYEFANHQALWYDCGGLTVDRENNDKKVTDRYATCDFNDCLTLERGELSYCSRAPNAWRIQGFERKTSDFCVVDDRKSFAEDLAEFVNNRHAMEACRYCYGTNEKPLIPAAIQME